VNAEGGAVGSEVLKAVAEEGYVMKNLDRRGKMMWWLEAGVGEAKWSISPLILSLK
jgi:hypothetical protein